MHNLNSRKVKLVWVSIFALSTLAFSCVDEGTLTVIPLPVWENDPDPKPIKPVTFPIYKNGDTLEYSASGQVTTYSQFGDINTQNSSGTLLIQWVEYLNLKDPYDGITIFQNVMKETRTLDATVLGKLTSIRYFTQDSVRCLKAADNTPTAVRPDTERCEDNPDVVAIDNPYFGTLYLLAVEYQNKLYWATTETTGLTPTFNDLSPDFTESSPLVTISAPKVYASPFNDLKEPADPAQNVKFRMMAGCSVTTKKCNAESATVIFDTVSIGVKETTETILGTFETMGSRLLLQSITTDITDSSADDYLPASAIDVNAGCNGSTSTTNDGNFEIHPSVGFVYIFTNCNGSTINGISFNLRFTLTQVSDALKIQ